MLPCPEVHWLLFQQGLAALECFQPSKRGVGYEKSVILAPEEPLTAAPSCQHLTDVSQPQAGQAVMASGSVSGLLPKSSSWQFQSTASFHASCVCGEDLFSFYRICKIGKNR